MSFSLFPVAMRGAVSAMQTMQTALAVTSANIANANTEGYTKKTTNISTLTVDGVGAGVKVDSVTRSVNEFLARELRDQMSATNAAGVTNQYYQNMQNMFGTPDSSGSLSMLLTDLQNNLTALSLDPQSPAAQQKVVLSAQAITANLNQSSQKIQDLRNQANLGIADSVTAVNSALDKIADLNQQISRATHLGQPTGDLEDERDRQLAIVSQNMDIGTYKDEDGQLVVFTGSGETLVDRAMASHLSYTPSSSMNATVTYPGGGASAITVHGRDITTSIKSGKLAALVDMRDNTLPNLGQQFDALAQQLMDQMNTIHNQGTSFPPPNTLTGTRALSGPTAVNMTGTARIAVVDANGNLVGSALDLDFSALSADVGGTPTLAQIRDAINGVYSGAAQPIPGLGGATASIDSSGHLVIAANSGTNGIAINEMNSAESTTGFGFSHYFGLNDMFVGTTNGGLAGSIAVRSDIVANPANLARGTLATGTVSAGSSVIGSGDNTNINALADRMAATVSFAPAGGLPALGTTLDGYAASILSNNAQAAAHATDNNTFLSGTYNDTKNKMGNDTGVSVDEELSNLMIYQNSYAASARLVTVVSDTLKELIDIVR
ncbi:MAG TPA: flagellar hook-associated protein FlgK [Alphaproteobacteria bacterium]|jgi:flagellar hook-associated protein 1 FlgK|nr:flagellar hook-associated protein FlgK [Alphaproteobacteria bacterium]